MENFITEIDIIDESKENFLTYAEEVLCDRAVPAAEDGLLSAQRKLLWTMEDYLKMDSSSKTKKCNAIVGSTLATSYFHGDQSCYGVLCKMSQEYLMRYPLVKGQGSLGTQENNDMVASSRYTEAKPSIFADIMFNDFKKNVVPLKETYNGEYMEPVVLPSLLPNAIVNGRQAIGISLSHNSLPHNLNEVCDALIAALKKEDKLTIDELMEYIQGPDFPLGGVVINKQDIREAFRTGKSKVSLKVRGNYMIEKDKIIFTTIPYRTYRNKIKEQINKNIEELSKVIDDFDDESSVGVNKLVFKVCKGVNPEAAVLKLFALTDLQTTLSYNMNYIVDGTPKLCSMIDLIYAYINHQMNVMCAAAAYDEEKAQARKHIIEGLLIAIEDIDKAIRLIRESKDRAEAEAKLVSNFDIAETQAKAILDMKLAKLTKLDKDDLLEELKSKITIIAECEKIKTNEDYRKVKLGDKVLAMKKKYGDARRTELAQIEVPKEEKEIETVVPEDCVVFISQSGDVKRVPAAAFKTQRRNGKGVKSEDDAVLDIISTNTVDTLMLFTDSGKMYRILVDNLPVGSSTSKGVRISSLINIDPNERVIAVTSLYRKTEAKYVVFITKQGMFKKTLIEEYNSVKKNTGIQAVKLKEGDSLASVTFCNEEEFILVSKQGMSIRFETAAITPIGRVAAGVKTIKLSEGDEVLVGLPIHNSTDTLAVFTKNGVGKKTSLDEYPVQGRNGKGLKCACEELVGAALVNDEDNILLVGVPNSICVSAKDIPTLGRTSLGNVMIKSSIVKKVVKL